MLRAFGVLALHATYNAVHTQDSGPSPQSSRHSFPSSKLKAHKSWSLLQVRNPSSICTFMYAGALTPLFAFSAVVRVTPVGRNQVVRRSCGPLTQCYLTLALRMRRWELPLGSVGGRWGRGGHKKGCVLQPWWYFGAGLRFDLH